jgi:hypothetical protein
MSLPATTALLQKQIDGENQTALGYHNYAL